MSRSRPVLLVTSSAAKLAAWRNSLGGAGIDALPPLELSENLSLDEIHVILSDHPFDPQQLNLPIQRLERGEIGVVLVGLAAPADVQLPADATNREVVLACRLLGQIVSQRRQLLREQRQQKLLRQAAATDSLTGLANRRAWDEMWQQLQHSPIRESANGHATVVALLDIDNFKRWNDEFGHALADQQLISVAERLAGAVRRGDFVFRWGGDEFAIVLSAVPTDRVATTVEQIRSAAGLNAPRSVTLSAGWAILAQQNGTFQPTHAFREADEQLRRAKNAGGNQAWPANG